MRAKRVNDLLKELAGLKNTEPQRSCLRGAPPAQAWGGAASRQGGGRGGRLSAGRGGDVYTERVKRWRTDKSRCGAALRMNAGGTYWAPKRKREML